MKFQETELLCEKLETQVIHSNRTLGLFSNFVISEEMNEDCNENLKYGLSSFEIGKNRFFIQTEL